MGPKQGQNGIEIEPKIETEWPKPKSAKAAPKRDWNDTEIGLNLDTDIHIPN